MAHIHPPLGKGKLVSLPYCDLGGILADSKDIESQLLQRALDYTKSRGIKSLEIREQKPLPNFDSEGTKHPSKVRMVLELPTDSNTLLSSLKSKLRSQIKKPQRDGLKIKSGGIDLLDEFYSIFVRNMTHLGSPAHSKKWFEKIISKFDYRAGIKLAVLPDGTPAAGGIYLTSSETFTIPWASSLREYNSWNPNMLLYWSFLEHATDKGYNYFDFGRSSPEDGTYKFKKQWGAEPYPLYWVNMLQNTNNGEFTTSFPANNNPSASYGRRLAEEIIRTMPVSANRFLGTKLRKYISL